MRRDIGFYVEAGIEQVYQAYLMAAKNPPFERDCREEPYHTIAFGVNFSMKYNMNGGSCNIHLMPSGTGTAVNMRFSIAQAVGARYGRYAEDLNTAMRRFLPVAIRPAEYDMDEFLKPQNQITPSGTRQARIVPAQDSQPVLAAPAPQTGAKSCTNCGQVLQPGSRFCSACGTPVPQERVCPACNTPAQEGARFCSNCGTRL